MEIMQNAVRRIDDLLGPAEAAFLHRVIREAENDDRPPAEVARLGAVMVDLRRAANATAELLIEGAKAQADLELRRREQDLDQDKSAAAERIAARRADALVQVAASRANASITVARRRCLTQIRVARLRARRPHARSGATRQTRAPFAPDIRDSLPGDASPAARPAPYGRKPDGSPYTHAEFLESLHEAVADIYGVDMKTGNEVIRPTTGNPAPPG